MTRPPHPSEQGDPLFSGIVTIWDPMTDKQFVDLAQVREILAAASYCYVHDTPPLTDEEAEVLRGENGDLDALCIRVVRI
jgi:hypothetical protein